MPDGIGKLVLMSLLLSAAAGAQETLRDPTRPYNARPVATASGGGGGSKAGATYSVTAIFTSDSRRVAVVNGRRVVEGDTVDGATVIEILANSLSLDVHGKVVTRRVLPTGLRK